MGFFERRAWARLDKVIKLGWPDAQTSILKNEYNPLGSMLRVYFRPDAVADIFIGGGRGYWMALAQVVNGTPVPVSEREAVPMKVRILAQDVDVAAEFVGEIWAFESMLEPLTGSGKSTAALRVGASLRDSTAEAVQRALGTPFIGVGFARPSQQIGVNHLLIDSPFAPLIKLYPTADGWRITEWSEDDPYPLVLPPIEGDAASLSVLVAGFTLVYWFSGLQAPGNPLEAVCDEDTRGMLEKLFRNLGRSSESGTELTKAAADFFTGALTKIGVPDRLRASSVFAWGGR